MTTSAPVAYQYSTLTSRPPAEVLERFASWSDAGLLVDERGPSYVVLKPPRQVRYGGDIAVALSVAVVLVALVLTAANVMFILLLVLAPLPALPLYFDNRPVLAVSAVQDESATRVTVHGQAPAEMGPAIERYLKGLPTAGPASGNVATA